MTNQDNLHELVNKIRLLASTGSEDQPLVLEVCDRVSTDVTAREAVRALMHEFYFGAADAQLSAARLWAILLRNSSAAFISQSAAPDFLAAVEELVVSLDTSAVVRNRVLKVLGDAVYNNPQRQEFRNLWMKVKGEDQPDQGLPHNAHDAILRPSDQSHQHNPQTILDRIDPPPPPNTAFDPRYRYEWESPPPYYDSESGNSTGRSLDDSRSTRSLPSTSSDIVLDISHLHIPRHQAEIRDSEQVCRVGEPDNSSGADIVAPLIVKSRDRPSPSLDSSMPVTPPRLEIDFPTRTVTQTEGSPTKVPGVTAPWTSSKSTSPRSTTPTPTAIRRLPLAQAGNRNNASVVASSSRVALTPRVHYPVHNYTVPRRKSTRAVYHRTLLYLKKVASRGSYTSAVASLSDFGDMMKDLNTVSSLVCAFKYRDTLLQVSSVLGVSDDPELKTLLHKDRLDIKEILLDIIYSPEDEQTVLRLEDDAAQSFLDLIQDTLDKALLDTSEASSKARRLIGKLSKACDKLPSSLIISGVTERDEHASFCGGFGDVYKAMYKGEPVALKHMRMFQDSDQRNIRRKFCRETLVWQHLHHPFIVPLIGIDTESFPSSLCMVSPWMKNGTVVRYLASMGPEDRQDRVNRLIQEIAQGLCFLHSRNVVHGDLRGSNILVDDTGHACLTDFGLTVLSDATAPTSTRAGSVRWMAPETLDPTACGHRDFARTPASDIYAYACVCLELYTGHPPFHEICPYDAPVIYKVVGGLRPSRPAGDSSIPDRIWKLMQRCWSHNSVDRPSIVDVVLELGVSNIPSGLIEIARERITEPDTTQNSDQDHYSISSGSEVEPTYSGWVSSVVFPLRTFIDGPINPRNFYRDLQEIADGPGGTTLYVARLGDTDRQQLHLPKHVVEKDNADRAARHTTFVAIKSIPIMPNGGPKLAELQRELWIMRDIRCENVLSMDAVYVDPVDDALWIRMELMTRSLASVVELNGAGLMLSDRVIAGCAKDILNALEYLHRNGIAHRTLRSDNVLISSEGVLKLTNFSNALPFPADCDGYSSNSSSDTELLSAIVWELAAGRRPNQDANQTPLSLMVSRSTQFHQFLRMCFEATPSRRSYRQLLESPFIRDACERPALVQLLLQCTALEGRIRDQGSRTR